MARAVHNALRVRENLNSIPRRDMEFCWRGGGIETTQTNKCKAVDMLFGHGGGGKGGYLDIYVAVLESGLKRRVGGNRDQFRNKNSDLHFRVRLNFRDQFGINPIINICIEMLIFITCSLEGGVFVSS